MNDEIIAYIISMETNIWDYKSNKQKKKELF